MTKNVGNWDRALRGIAAMASFTCSVMAPLPLAVRAIAFGGMGAYLARGLRDRNRDGDHGPHARSGAWRVDPRLGLGPPFPAPR